MMVEDSKEVKAHKNGDKCAYDTNWKIGWEVQVCAYVCAKQ